MIYLDACRGLNHIGRLGENEHRTVRFWESAEALAMYPEASVTVLHKRPGDPAAYPVAPGYVSIQDGVVCWTIQSGDLARPGRGKVELVFTQGEVVAKTLIWDTMIDQALDGAGEPPEPWESWIAEVTAAGEHAPQIIDGEWWAWSVADEEYINTHVPATGPEGNGIRSVQLNQDYTLTIAFTNGSSYTTSSIRGEPGADYVISQADYAAIAAIVMADAGFQEKVNAAEAAADLACELATGEHLDGTPSSTHNENNAYYYMLLCRALTGKYPKIENGYWYLWNAQSEQWVNTGVAATGADGVSPTVSISDITGGHRVTITDATGDHSFDVMDGTNGTNGTDGTDGEDGVTFTPSVSSAGVISWTNDGNRQNPSPVDIPALVEGVFVETVSGTTPSITGADNHRYVCGEVSTISITAPASGTIEVIFESGSTAAILTASGVMWPDWFDDTALETDRIYDVMITDGLYGSVMSWASV